MGGCVGRLWAWVAVFGLGILGGIACGPVLFGCAGSEVCNSDGDQGVCQASGYCSYGDPRCESGQRYSPHAGEGLAGGCVAPARPTQSGDTDDASGAPTTSSTSGSDSDATINPLSDSDASDGSGSGSWTSGDSNTGSTGAMDGSSGTGLEGDCVDVDGGSVLGEIASGSTVGEANDWDPTCGTADTGDVIIAWVAPDDGHYHVRSLGSDYDTVLAVLAACDGPEIECNDDDSDTQDASNIGLDLLAGQKIFIVIDGDGAEGNYVVRMVQQQ